MSESTPTRASYAYRAQTREGEPISGTLDAPDVEDLTRQLSVLGLRPTEFAPATRPERVRAIRGEDFIAFNQQLALLTSAGMPVEAGLRLIATDMRRGALAATVRSLAAELERGTPLPEALARYESQFPPLYGRLVQAGIKSNNLPAMLLSLGRHVELVARLRAAIWRAAAYPVAILLGVLIVLLFVGTFILPQLANMYATMRIPDFQMWPGRGVHPPVARGLPLVTRILLASAPAVPWIVAVIIVAIAGSSLIWALMRRAGVDRRLVDMATRMPLIGPVLKKNLLARWLDAMHIAAAAGLDLPASISLACDAVGSPALTRDGEAIISALESGRSIESASPLHFLPASVPAAIALAAKSGELPLAMDTMAQLQQRQAEIRLAVLPALLTPLLLMMVGGVIILVLAGLLLPLFRMLNWLSGGAL